MKTVRAKAHGGSNPSACAKHNKSELYYHDKVISSDLLFVEKLILHTVQKHGDTKFVSPCFKFIIVI